MRKCFGHACPYLHASSGGGAKGLANGRGMSEGTHMKAVTIGADHTEEITKVVTIKFQAKESKISSPKLGIPCQKLYRLNTLHLVLMYLVASLIVVRPWDVGSSHDVCAC